MFIETSLTNGIVTAVYEDHYLSLGLEWGRWSSLVLEGFILKDSYLGEPFFVEERRRKNFNRMSRCWSRIASTRLMFLQGCNKQIVRLRVVWMGSSVSATKEPTQEARFLPTSPKMQTYEHIGSYSSIQKELLLTPNWYFLICTGESSASLCLFVFFFFTDWSEPYAWVLSDLNECVHHSWKLLSIGVSCQHLSSPKSSSDSPTLESPPSWCRSRQRWRAQVVDEGVLAFLPDCTRYCAGPLLVYLELQLLSSRVSRV